MAARLSSFGLLLGGQQTGCGVYRLKAGKHTASCSLDPLLEARTSCVLLYCRPGAPALLGDLQLWSSCSSTCYSRYCSVLVGQTQVEEMLIGGGSTCTFLAARLRTHHAIILLEVMVISVKPLPRD